MNQRGLGAFQVRDFDGGGSDRFHAAVVGEDRRKIDVPVAILAGHACEHAFERMIEHRLATGGAAQQGDRFGHAGGQVFIRFADGLGGGDAKDFRLARVNAQQPQRLRVIQRHADGRAEIKRFDFALLVVDFRELRMQLLLRDARFMDIVGDAEPLCDRSTFIAQRQRAQKPPARRAVGCAHQARINLIIFAGQNTFGPHRKHAEAVGFVEAAQVFVAIARDEIFADVFEEALVGVHHAAFGVGGPERLRIELGEHAIAFFARLQRGLLVAVVGDVAVLQHKVARRRAMHLAGWRVHTRDANAVPDSERPVKIWIELVRDAGRHHLAILGFKQGADGVGEVFPMAAATDLLRLQMTDLARVPVRVNDGPVFVAQQNAVAKSVEHLKQRGRKHTFSAGCIAFRYPFDGHDD